MSIFVSCGQNSHKANKSRHYTASPLPLPRRTCRMAWSGLRKKVLNAHHKKFGIVVLGCFLRHVEATLFFWHLVLGENNPLPLRMAWREVNCIKKLALHHAHHDDLISESKVFSTSTGLYLIYDLDLTPWSILVTEFAHVGETYQLNDLTVGHTCCLISCFEHFKGLRKRHQAGAERCYLYRTSLGVHFFVGHTITHNRNGQEPSPLLGQTDTSHQHHQGQGTTSLNRRGWNGKVALSVCAKGVGGRGNLLT